MFRPEKKAASKRFALLRLSMLLAAMPIGGCTGIQSMLDPQGPQAQSIAAIAWVMFWGAGAVLLLVMALALYALFRAPEKRKKLTANTFVIAGGLALPILTLSALLFYGVHAMGDLRGQPAPTQHIEVVANRWWWDVHYHDNGKRVASTANEIRIPAGKPVTVLLKTNDVIHSFWVPALAGKMDLIPGRTNRIVLHANAPGTFRGQCAEFCGAQHARMAFYVIAEHVDAHADWLARQALPAATPSDTDALRGREAFSAHCAQCHTVRGITSATRPGPDLTHFASRQFIAAGTLENNRANLIDFIARSQAIKPGNAMPSHDKLDDATLQALASFLESLK